MIILSGLQMHMTTITIVTTVNTVTLELVKTLRHSIEPFNRQMEFYRKWRISKIMKYSLLFLLIPTTKSTVKMKKHMMLKDQTS